MASPLKRKRVAKDQTTGQKVVCDSGSSSDSDGPGPQRPPTGPSAPVSTTTIDKRRRVMGPAAPPTSLLHDNAKTSNSNSNSNSNSDSDSSDDDFGPKPPSMAESHAIDEAARTEKLRLASQVGKDTNTEDEGASKPQRAGWMTAVPVVADISARVDPTKLRPGKFNTNRRGGDGSAKTDEISSIWTETVDEKRKRLKNQVLGIGESKTAAGGSSKSTSDREMARRITAQIEKDRGKSLLVQRDAAAKDIEGKKKSLPAAEEEDDPSNRGFDYSKDVANTSRVNTSQRNEMVSKMGQFSSKFAGGNFL